MRYLILAVCLLVHVSGKPQSTIRLGEGILAGEVTKHSVILQARLTQTDTLVAGDVPGAIGMACFEVATDSSFTRAFRTPWQAAVPEADHIIKMPVADLRSHTRYYYRLRYGLWEDQIQLSRVGTFRTLAGAERAEPVRLALATCMNYALYYTGRYRGDSVVVPGYSGDRLTGYPALVSILAQRPDYFISMGDNVYYDRRVEGQKNAETRSEMRQRWHEQFVQSRYHDLFARVPTYWEKDDHDYRVDDADPYLDTLPTHALGVATFREQVPIVNPYDVNPVTYRTHRINRDVQIWLTEGRDYRSPNAMADGPDKTLWGEAQKAWLKETLLASDATFKFLISPTPMVGPDDARKRDNHTNQKGFRHERDAFFRWLKDNNLLGENFYVICGDRHWQYHAIDPLGVEEFSSGALMDANARLGRVAGDPASTDPEATVRQPYLQPKASGGFLMVEVIPAGAGATATFTHYDEHGAVLYETVKDAQ